MPSLLPRILLVDDEPEVLEILNEYLCEVGFAVRTAMEANEALMEAKRWTPKAILLDVMMPNLGGLEILELKRFDVRRATCGEEALAKVAESCPDIVLLDLGMAGLSGIETLRRLRSDSPSACVVVVSGNQDQDLAQKALAMGATDYVPKP